MKEGTTEVPNIPSTTEISTDSEHTKKKKGGSLHFGTKVIQNTLQGTKNVLHKSKHAVQDTVKTVHSTTSSAVISSSERLQSLRGKSRSHEQPTTRTTTTTTTTQTDKGEQQQQQQQQQSNRSIITTNESNEKEVIIKENGVQQEKLATTTTTAPISQATTTKSFSWNNKVISSSEYFGTKKEMTLLHLSLVLVTYPTYKYWTTLIHLPMSLVLSWLFVAFSLGNWISCYMSNISPTISRQDEDLVPESVKRPSIQPKSISQIEFTSSERTTTSWTSTTWSRRLFTSRHFTPAFMNPMSMSASLKRWNCDPTCDQKHRQLMHLLLKNRNLRRKRKVHNKNRSSTSGESGSPMVVPTDLGDDTIESVKASMAIGNFQLADADSFGDIEDYIIEPSFKLKGMDVFLCEPDGGVPETQVADHSWFIKHGLREAPTFLVNISTQWGNILLYFALPDWMKDWDSLQEKDEDSNEIRALKNFFRGTDEYRDSCLMFMPSVVEAPYAVRCISPSKQEYPMGDRPYLPLLWTKYPADTANNKAIAMELEIDCMSSGWVRSMAGIVKRNLVSLSIDVAVLLKSEDAQLCLALWRFDHVDISSSPIMPTRESNFS